MENLDLKSILERPLIIGASVSGDFLAPSPGRILAERYTSPENIKVIAGNGRRGAEVLRSISDEILEDRTVVIGMDLFFWDSFNLSPSPALTQLTQFLERLDKKGIPFVLGEIPEFTSDYQMSIAPLNKAIHDSCSTYDSCRLLPLNHLLQTTIDEGFLIHRGKKFPLNELLPDGLHIGNVASEYLADRISDCLTR